MDMACQIELPVADPANRPQLPTVRPHKVTDAQPLNRDVAMRGTDQRPSHEARWRCNARRRDEGAATVVTRHIELVEAIGNAPRAHQREVAQWIVELVQHAK